MKPINFEKDAAIEIRHLRTIKAILGNYFIAKDPSVDMRDGVDFLILRINPFRIGIRLRRFKYLAKYPDEFTLRWSRPSGLSTEIDKIRKGFVDYIFYGFVNKNESKIIQYFIGDLTTFRKDEPKPIAILKNEPPDSELAVYKLSAMPDNFILKFYP